MMPNTYNTRVTSTRPGYGTGDTIVTYEDEYGNRYEKSFACGTNVSISVNKWSSSDNVQPNRIEVTRTVVPEFEGEKTKYWKPPKPPRNPKKLPEVREDRRAKRVILRPEFHARSNPRSR
jgi:phage-related protein